MMRAFVHNALLLAVSLMLGAVLIETVLRLADPFDMRVSGDRIMLEFGRVYEIDQDSGAPDMDARIVHTKNRLGFRGEEWPADPAGREKWIFVGGSTTESFYFNDADTWVEIVYRLQRARRPDLWVNNAGLDGHSSYGHMVLTRDFLVDLRPEKVIFLTGINDVGYDAPNSFEDRLVAGGPVTWLRLNTEIGKLASLLWRKYKAVSLDLVHGFHDDWAATIAALQRFETPADTAAATLAAHRERYIPGYRARVAALLDLVAANRIEPVLMTQPALFGPGRDVATGLDLGRTSHPDVTGTIDGATRWAVLEAYNDAVRALARERGVALIDLARAMPKDSRLYYDWIHLNKSGQAALARIVSDRLDALFPVE